MHCLSFALLPDMVNLQSSFQLIKRMPYLPHLNSANVLSRGRIFSHVQPFYEQAVSDLYQKRYMHRPV